MTEVIGHQKNISSRLLFSAPKRRGRAKSSPARLDRDTCSASSGRDRRGEPNLSVSRRHSAPLRAKDRPHYRRDQNPSVDLGDGLPGTKFERSERDKDEQEAI